MIAIDLLYGHNVLFAFIFLFAVLHKETHILIVCPQFILVFLLILDCCCILFSLHSMKIKSCALWMRSTRRLIVSVYPKLYSQAVPQEASLVLFRLYLSVLNWDVRRSGNNYNCDLVHTRRVHRLLLGTVTSSKRLLPPAEVIVKHPKHYLASACSAYRHYHKT